MKLMSFKKNFRKLEIAVDYLGKRITDRKLKRHLKFFII